jgi:hypothetical protein
VRGKWVIDYNSQLLIHGKTNVNSFTCFISCYNNNDTLEYDHDISKRELKFKTNKMVIPVYNFNCGSNLITKDFRRTAKADKNPYLNIGFISLEKNADDLHMQAKMQIQLAGVTKLVDVQFEARTQGSFLQLTGTHQVRFADFGMKAPARALGLVKVNEDLIVEFNLLIKPITE